MATHCSRPTPAPSNLPTQGPATFAPITDTTIAPPPEDTLAPTTAPTAAPTAVPTTNAPTEAGETLAPTRAPAAAPTAALTEANETLAPTTAPPTATGSGSAPPTASPGSPPTGGSGSSSTNQDANASVWLLPMVVILAFVIVVAVVVAIVALRRSGKKRAEPMNPAASIWGSRPATMPNPAYASTHPPANAAMPPNPVYVGPTSSDSPAMLPNPVYVGTPPPVGTARSPNPAYVGPDSTSSGGGGSPPSDFTIVPGRANPAAYGTASSRSSVDANAEYDVLVRGPAASDDNKYAVLDPVSGSQRDTGLSATGATYASIAGVVYKQVGLPVYKTTPVWHGESPHVYEYDARKITPESKTPYAVASAAPKAVNSEGSPAATEHSSGQHNAPEMRGMVAYEDPDVVYEGLADDGDRKGHLLPVEPYPCARGKSGKRGGVPDFASQGT